MDRRKFGAGGTRSRYHLESEGPTWLYDPVTEEFLPDPGPMEHPGMSLPRPSREDGPRDAPASRAGCLAHWLFVRGWMSVVLIGGLMLLGLGAWAIGLG